MRQSFPAATPTHESVPHAPSPEADDDRGGDGDGDGDSERRFGVDNVGPDGIIDNEPGVE